MLSRLLFLILLAAFVSHSSGTPNDNWAVLVCSSRYWFNYRHVANTLAMYRTVKRMGIPDSQVILMLSDDMACNARNPFTGRIFNQRDHRLDLYGSDIEVDYRGTDVSVESLLRLLTGRHDDEVPRSKRLLTNERSNVFIFMSGHGGDGFLKFQDQEELSSQDLADALDQMHRQRRYREVFLMLDTCQAGSMHQRITAPNIVAIGSSQVGESSYAYELDSKLGLASVDRFTHYTLAFFERHGPSAFHQTITDLFSSYDPYLLSSTPDWRANAFGRELHLVPLLDFFSARVRVHPLRSEHLNSSSLADIAAGVGAELGSTTSASDTITAAIRFFPPPRPSPQQHQDDPWLWSRTQDNPSTAAARDQDNSINIIEHDQEEDTQQSVAIEPGLRRRRTGGGGGGGAAGTECASSSSSLLTGVIVGAIVCVLGLGLRWLDRYFLIQLLRNVPIGSTCSSSS